MTYTSLAQAAQPSSPIDQWSLAPHQPAPRDDHRLLVAIASGSGACIDGSFEDTEAFLLFEKCGRQTCFIGRQPCALSAAGSDTALRARLLADCDLVLCADISDTSRQNLSTLGIDCDLAHAGSAINDAVSML